MACVTTTSVTRTEMFNARSGAAKTNCLRRCCRRQMSGLYGLGSSSRRVMSSTHRVGSFWTFNLHTTLLYSLIYIHLAIISVANAQQQSFEVSPKPTFVIPGQSATFYCKINNKSGVLYWEKNGRLLTLENQRFSATPTNWAIFGNMGDGEYNLQIVNVQKEDAGEYCCKVTQPTGGVNLTSDPVQLTVVDLPEDQDFPMCLMSVRETLVEGYVVDFTCIIHDPSSTAELRWQRLDTPLTIIPNVQQSLDDYTQLKQTVTMSAVDHNAQYQCIYTSGDGEFIGSRSCSTGILTVMHRPTITITPSVYSAVNGATARFTCHMDSAYPGSVAYKWRYRERDISASEHRFEFVVGAGASSSSTADNTEQELIMSDITSGDDGWRVICQVSNAVGTSEVSSVIRINFETVNQITLDEFLQWLIPIGCLTALLLISILIVIALYNVCPCCKKPRGNTKNYSWSSSDHLSNGGTRRDSDTSSAGVDYYMTRQIRSSSRNDNSVRTPTPSPIPQVNHGYSGSPNMSPIPPNSASPLPPNQISAISLSPDMADNGHMYKQRKTRGERDRRHVRREPQMRRKNTGPKQLIYADLDLNGNNNGRGGGNGARNGVRPSTGFSDSGLDFANSSVDSRAATPQEERIVYARIVRSNSTPDTQDLIMEDPRGNPPRHISGSNRQVTREELADMLIHS